MAITRLSSRHVLAEKQAWSMKKEGRSMRDDKGSLLGGMGWAFVIGGLVGGGIALLLAPQSGSASRKQLRGYARRVEESIHGLTDKVAEVFDEAVDKGREFVKDNQAVLSEAAEAGRAAIQREREPLSAEKKA
jgi:gas vesicle protein